MNETILTVESAHTFIGHHHILQGLSFEAKADAVTVLIGRNGADNTKSRGSKRLTINSLQEIGVDVMIAE